MIGVKGMKPGEALMAMDKTKVLLRLEAEAYADDEGKIKLRNTKKEKVNVTDIILDGEDGGKKDADKKASGKKASGKKASGK